MPDTGTDTANSTWYIWTGVGTAATAYNTAADYSGAYQQAGQAWQHWQQCGGYAQTGGALTATGTGLTWYTWCAPSASGTSLGAGGYQQTLTTTTNATWTYWVDSGTFTMGGAQSAPIPASVPDAEAYAAATARLEARRKAQALLDSMLDQAQREQLEREHFFEFISQLGRRYRMKRGFSRNIDELAEDGRRVKTLSRRPLTTAERQSHLPLTDESASTPSD